MNTTKVKNHNENKIVKINNNVKNKKINNTISISLTFDNNLNYALHVNRLNNKLKSVSGSFLNAQPL